MINGTEVAETMTIASPSSKQRSKVPLLFISFTIVCFFAVTYLPLSTLEAIRWLLQLREWYEDDFVYWYLKELPLSVQEYNATVSEAIANFTRSHSQRFRQEALRHFFAPKMTPEEAHTLMLALGNCLKMLDDIKVRHMIYSGTILGYYRHNKSAIPWDDDADVAVFPRNDEEIPVIVSTLVDRMNFYPDMALHYVEEQKRLKCFFKANGGKNRSIAIDGYPWRWPFVDLQLMRVTKPSQYLKLNGSLIEDATVQGFQYSEHMIFPLHRGYFGAERVPVFLPHDLNGVIAKTFKASECRSPDYDHHFEERPIHIVTVICSELQPFISGFTNIF